MNNPQYRGQGYNGQDPQFGNPNNPQFSNQNGYNNPNQFNPQFGNNQNFNPMNRGPKMDSKMIGYITAAVATILVVLMIFMFSSGSGKPGGATPEEAVKNGISAMKDGDFEKLLNNCYFESDEARTKFLAEFKNLNDNDKIELVNKFSEVEIGEVKSINENSAKVELKGGGDTRPMYVKKVNGRWFIEDK
ncbi:Lumazine-binding domain protein [Gemella haemolysans]|nr:Lumazine-binding domain protein [Gemella haemolysans]